MRIGNRTTLVAALIAGALGGAMSARILPAASANAAPAKSSLMNITARNFEVMDAQGNERARLGVSSQGLAQLGMYDEQGIERAAIAVTRQGTTLLAMTGDDGKPRLSANVPMHDGPAAFKLLNRDSSTAAELIMNKDDRALVLADDKGHPRLRLDLNAAAKGGAATLTFYDKDGKMKKTIP